MIEKGRKRREQIEGEGERKGGRKVVGREREREKLERIERKERERESQEKEDVDYQYLDLKKKKGPRGGEGLQRGDYIEFLFFDRSCLLRLGNPKGKKRERVKDTEDVDY